VVALLFLAALSAGAFLLFRGAPPDEPSPESPLIVDLAQSLPAADFSADTAFFYFGAAGGKQHYAELDQRYHERSKGWLSVSEGPKGRSFAFLVGGEGRVRVTRSHPESDWIEMTGCAVEGGEGDHAAMRLFLNDRLVGETELPRGSEPVSLRFDGIRDALIPGDNELRIEVDGGAPVRMDGFDFPLTLSAAFASLRLDGVVPPEPPGPLAVPGRGREEPSALIQPSGTTLSSYHAPGPGEAIAAQVSVKGTPLRVALAAQAAGASAPEQREWVVKPGESREISLDLGSLAGKVCRIDLLAGLPGVSKPGAYARWEAPRIVRSGSGAAARAAADGADAALRPAGSVVPPDEEKPSIVVILLDAASTLFFQSLTGEAGAAPGADRLARDAVAFPEALTPAPYTLPAVGSIFTGCLPDRHGVVWNASRDGQNLRLAPKRRTLASALQREGYATLAVVTNPNAAAFYGYGDGFDRYEELFNNPNLWEEGVAPDAAVEQAQALIALHRAAAGGKPFSLYLPLFQPHEPYDPPAPFKERFVKPYQGAADGSRAVIDGFKDRGIPDLSPADFDHLRELYAANLAYADDAAARFVEWLRDQGLYEKSLIVLCSDHGEAFGEHRSIEHGHHLYEEALRVPLLVKYPGNRHAGEAVRETVCLTDLAPTLVAAAGGELESGFDDGVDLTPRVEAGEGGAACARKARVFLARSDVFRPSFSLRRSGYHYIFDSLNRGQELYDLSRDPRQERNLVRDEPIMAGYLRTQLFHRLVELFRSQEGETVSVSEEFIQAIESIGYTGGRGAPSQGAPGEGGADLFILPGGRR